METVIFTITKEEGEEYGLPIGTFELHQIATLIRDNRYDHDVVAFLATVLTTHTGRV